MKVKDLMPILMKLQTMNSDADVIFVYGPDGNAKYFEPKEIGVEYRQRLVRNSLEQDKNTILLDLGEG